MEIEKIENTRETLAAKCIRIKNMNQTMNLHE